MTVAAEISVMLVGDDVAGDGGIEERLDRLSVVAVDGVEGGLDRIGRPDVAVVDGLDRLAAVREGAPTVPVVVAGGDWAAAMEAGADEWVPADAPPALLARRVADVADRRRARRRARALLADPATAVGILDREGRLRAVNGTALAFAGVDREDVLGRPLEELPWVTRSSDPGAYEAAVGRALDGDVERVRVEVPDARDVTRTIDVIVRPLPGPDGVEGVVLEGRDVGVLIDEGAALEPPSRRLHTIIDNVPVVLFAFDDEGTVTLLEGRGLDALGVEPGELVGEPVFEVVPDGEAIHETVRRALDGEHVTDVFEAGGRWFEAWYQPIEADGAVRGVMGVAVDVTERRERERELEQYRTLVETVGDPMYVLDAEGTIEMVNEAMAEQLGYDREELLGEHVSLVLTDESVREGEQLIAELLADDDRRWGTYELTAVTKDGEHVPYEDNVGIVTDEDGRLRKSVGVVRDVTERKRRERELQRQNERLEEFASVVSHDLRNPLNVATGTTDLLAEQVEAEELDRLRSSLDRMEALIEDLLRLARKGQLVTDAEPVDLAAVAEDAWATVTAPEASLAVETDATIEADRSRLRELLENLFANAVEHAGPDVRVEVGDLQDGRGFYVADDGPGIPAEEREEVFEYGVSTAEEGTGFGLAIVRSIAEAHGWAIAVAESDAGGARFEVAGVEPAI